MNHSKCIVVGYSKTPNLKASQKIKSLSPFKSAPPPPPPLLTGQVQNQFERSNLG